MKDEKINYTSYLRDKPQETDPAKLTVMKTVLVQALKARGVHGQYYNLFDSNTGKFFSGYIGD